MENKHKSDTLEQRKKAQRDFLELKKMQSGETLPQKKPSEVYAQPQNAADRFKNFWDYNKWFVIGGLAIALVIAFCVAKCAAAPKYDLRIAAYTSNILGDSDCLAMQEYFKCYCEDINGDGQINVQVINCSYSDATSTREHKYSNQTKIQGIISAEADILLYITDDTTHKALSEIGNDVKLISNDSIALGEKFYTACETDDEIPLPEGLGIVIRTVKGTTIENDKNIDTYLSNAENVLSKLAE